MATSEPSFPKFPELPTELRLQIWALSIPTRVVPITCIKGVRPPNRRFAQHFDTTVAPPALLLCNHESRSVALTTYTFNFRTEARPHGIPVSFEHDTFSFPDNTISYLEAADRELIRRMVLAVADHVYFGLYNFELLRAMAALRELELRVSVRVMNSWTDDFATVLFRDFRLEAIEWEEWELPALVRVVRADTGEVAWVVRGREGLRLEEVT